MARKVSTTPARIWKYGLPFGPAQDDAEAVNNQIFLGRLFHNELLSLHIKSRKEYREARERLVPGFAEAEEKTGTIKAELDAINKEIKAASIVARKKIKATPLQVSQKKEIGARIKKARGAFAPLRDIAKSHKGLKVASSAIDDQKKVDIKKLRKEFGECAWGTRGRIEQALQKSATGKFDPVHRRWDGSGNIAVQIINTTTSKRLYTEGLLECTDTRVRLELGEFKRGRRRATLWMRIGSESQSKAPVWARLPCIYHRPLPPGAEIKSVWAQRRRIGPGRDRWEVCFQLESATFETPARLPTHSCAINLGWRQRGEGLRVCYVVGTDGHTGEILMPYGKPIGVIHRLDHADSLRSTRDKHLNTTKSVLVAWLKENRDKVVFPEALQDSFDNVWCWKSPGRLYKLARLWASNRFEGDGDAFTMLQTWMHREVHLYQYESGERTKALGHRKDFYQRTALRLCKRYSTIEVQKFDLRNPARKPEPGSEEPTIAKARLNMRRAALSEFRGALKLAASNTGTTLRIEADITIDGTAATMTATCHVCGGYCEWDHVQLMHTCEHCGAAWDQDENHCRNLLDSRHAEVAE